GGFSPSRIEIFDIYGKSIFSTLLHNASKEIDLSNFADGIYLYKVYSQTELLATGRILKQ
ncbi:MAG: T9SS type A sorting domain-containing protein, partial [Bacteroidetes bacterium]|nr:T9SS type A sorting domain-containing protein [Bacteroidota bacterium]